MPEVRFYENCDADFRYVVIVAQKDGQWVFSRHRARTTLECPGGHIEPGETPLQAAKRELWEETGATAFDLKKICAYSVASENNETFGVLFYADIREIGLLPPTEIAEVFLLGELPKNWTYPLIQPLLVEKVKSTVGL